MTMAYLYLNDWSMEGNGDLVSQWTKVERWCRLMKSLSSTYGITKIGVPHDFKKRRLCGYVLSNCFVSDNFELPVEKRNLLLVMMNSYVEKADYDDTTSRIVDAEKGESLCVGRAYDQKASVVSFTFDERYGAATVSGTISGGRRDGEGCTVRNLYDEECVKIEYLVPCSVSKCYDAIDNPMWNQEMMKAYCQEIGHTADRKSATTGEKISYLRLHGKNLAVMNGWIVDENKTKLNQDESHQRLIFRSVNFHKDDCYLSIDFEKEDFHFELLDHRGRHLKEIDWHGNQTGAADSKHNIRMKKK